MATKDRPIAYEPHPVTLERKKELIGLGFRIIDVKFKPPGVAGTLPPAGMKFMESSTSVVAPIEAPVAAVDELSAADMRAELTARGVEFKPNAPKAALAELLKASE